MDNWSEESETWEEKSKRKNLWSIAAATAATALLGCCQLSWHKYSNSNRLLLFEYLSNSWFWMTGSGQGRSYICETFIEMNVGIEITTIYISETFYSKFAKVYTPYLFFFSDPLCCSLSLPPQTRLKQCNADNDSQVCSWNDTATAPCILCLGMSSLVMEAPWNLRG